MIAQKVNTVLKSIQFLHFPMKTPHFIIFSLFRGDREAAIVSKKMFADKKDKYGALVSANEDAALVGY